MTHTQNIFNTSDLIGEDIFIINTFTYLLAQRYNRFF